MEVQLQTCFTLSFAQQPRFLTPSVSWLPAASPTTVCLLLSNDVHDNSIVITIRTSLRLPPPFSNIKDRQTKSVNHKKVGDDGDGIGKGAYCLFALPINGGARAGGPACSWTIYRIYDERRGTALMPSESERPDSTDWTEQNRTRKLSIEWVYFYPPCNKSHETRIPIPQFDVELEPTMLLLRTGHWIDSYFTGKLSGNGCEFQSPDTWNGFQLLLFWFIIDTTGL